MELRYQGKVLGGEGGKEIYSTEETLIGTWIDGKPLYRIVLTGTTPTQIGSNGHILHRLSDDRIVRRIEGWFLYNERQTQPFNSYAANNDSSTYLFYVRGDVTLLNAGTNALGKEYWIILEYTKTTE